MGERLNLTPEQQRKVERAQALLQEVWNAMTQEARAGSHHRTAGAVATITAPKDNPMPNEPTPAWRARLEHGVLPEEPGRRVLVSADDRDAALSALDAATARAAKAEEENKILIQMHQHMCDLVGHDQAEAYHTGRHANLEAQTALIAALEAQLALAAPLLEAAKAWSNSFAREAVFDPTTTGRQRQIARGVLLDNLKRAAEALPSHPQDPGHE